MTLIDIRKVTNNKFVAPAVAKIRKQKMHAEVVDKTAIPTREARVATLGIGKVHVYSTKITIGTRNKLEAVTCPVTVITGDTPIALNLRPKMPAKA